MNRLLLLALISFVALSASAGAGYLAVIGPAPLRFEGRARPVPHAIAMLPPLLMQDPVPPAPPTNAVALATTNPPPPAVAQPIPVITNVAVATVTVTNAPIVFPPTAIPPATGPLLSPMFDPSDPNSLLTAQMLIRYFRPVGTNGGTAVIGPLFLPPPPPQPPSSKATYSTPTHTP